MDSSGYASVRLARTDLHGPHNLASVSGNQQHEREQPATLDQELLLWLGDEPPEVRAADTSAYATSQRSSRWGLTPRAGRARRHRLRLRAHTAGHPSYELARGAGRASDRRAMR